MEFNKILKEFEVQGEVTPLGAGLINDTYKVGDFVLQKINPKVFPYPELVMENFSKVSHHLEKKLNDPRKFLKLKPTRTGLDYLLHEGSCWRLVYYIPDSVSFTKPPSDDHCFEAANKFASFQKNLLDLNGITPTKRQKFDLTGKINEFKSQNITPEIKWAFNHYFEINLDLPKRVIHHDTKISNVLFDKKSGKGLCVIDLDTVAENPILWDFGDMVRSMSPWVSEEEDFSQVDINMEFYKAIVLGYLSNADFMEPKERYSLFDGVLMITYTLALRFLSDHLDGDIYFKVKYPGHNLARAKNQMRLFEVFLKNQKELRHIIAVG